MICIKKRKNKMKHQGVKTAALLLTLAISASALSACSLFGKTSEASEASGASSAASTTVAATTAPATQAPATEQETTEPADTTPRKEAPGSVIGSAEEGYSYVGEDGTVNPGYCDGVTVDGQDWIVIEGAAYQVKTDSDKCLFAAAKDVAKCTDPGMTREEKLKACFDYIKSNYLEGVLHDPPYSFSEPDWPVVYANDIFVDGMGDCFSYGAAYAYMARAIGYTESYACNSGGHGWAEVEERTYDPEWSLHSDNYSYYGMRYDEECDVPYAFAIENGRDQKRRQIIINE